MHGLQADNNHFRSMTLHVSTIPAIVFPFLSSETNLRYKCHVTQGKHDAPRRAVVADVH